VPRLRDPALKNGIGLPVAEGEQRTCAQCAWAFQPGARKGVLRCRQAGDARVEVRWRACVKADFDLDCLTCGACCAVYKEVPIDPEEPLLEERPELTTDSRVGPVMRRVGDRCIAMALADGKHRCSIYEIRPQVCRDFEPGSEDCLSACQRMGLSRS